jgi:hypothetical protein
VVALALRSFAREYDGPLGFDSDGSPRTLDVWTPNGELRGVASGNAEVGEGVIGVRPCGNPEEDKEPSLGDGGTRRIAGVSQ